MSSSASSFQSFPAFDNIKSLKEYRLPTDICDDGFGPILIPTEPLTFVTVPDFEEALSAMVDSVAARTGTPIETLQEIFGRHYMHHMEAQCKLISDAHASVERNRAGEGSGRGVLICALDPQVLNEGVRSRIGESFALSLKAGDREANYELGLSRLFSVGGSEKFSMTPRPGRESVFEQLQEIHKLLAERGTKSVVLCDDHAFTCKTLVDVVKLLQASGIEIEKIVTYTQVGESEELRELGIQIDPVRNFEVISDEKNPDPKPLDCIELVEMRYFLLGAGGCVVELPDGTLGRAPYFLPFASPSNRASIPAQTAEDFSIKTLNNNMRFFTAVEAEIGTDVLLSDAHPAFRDLAVKVHNFHPDTPLRHVAQLACERLADLTTHVARINADQLKLNELDLPSQILLLDVNGTLVPDGQPGLPMLLEGDLVAAIQEVEKLGISVGLCSDSPLPQLRDFARRHKISGPIVAENGNIVAYGEREVRLRTLPDITAIKRYILEKAAERDLTQVDDVTAIEFSTDRKAIVFNPREFGFGADRESSVTVFGDRMFIEQLSRSDFTASVGANVQFSIDANPDWGPYGVMSIHPGEFREGKSETLATLKAFRCQRVIMVGNSNSDLTDDPSVECLLVGDHTASPEQMSRVRKVAAMPGPFGVVELLRSLKESPSTSE